MPGTEATAAPPAERDGAAGSGSEGLRRYNPLPQGAAVIGMAYALSGLTTYGFLVIASRALGPVAYSPLSALWALTFVVVPGLFLPLEQESGRAVSARRALGIGARPVIARAAGLGGVLGAAIIVLGLVASGPLVGALFDGQTSLLLGLSVAIACYCAYYLGRGVLAGNARFGAYATLLVVEGGVRIAAAGALWVAGVRSAGAYSLAIGLPCLIGLGAVLVTQRRLAEPGPAAPWSELSRALGWLLAGSLLAQLLVNIGPLAVKAFFSGGDATAAGRFLNGLVVARVPLFFFQAVQASLMPKLAADAAHGRMDAFAGTLRKLLALIAAVVVVSVLGMLALGPLAVQIMFGSGFELSRLDLGLLAFGSELMMAALTLAYSAIALGGYARAALGWTAGIVVLAAVAAVVPGTLVRLEVAFCAGMCAAVAVLGVALRGLMVRRRALPA